jgi:hypothetical protein
MLFNLKKLSLGLFTVLIIGLVAGFSESTAQAAGDGYRVAYGHYPSHERVVVGYRWVQQPYQVWVTKHHPCGTAYRVLVTRYRPVKVPIYGTRYCR